MKIQNNISAMNTNRLLKKNNSKLAGALEKLSSGYQINRSGDDAAGLAISEKMRAMIHGLTQAEKNCHDAISLFQTAEGALDEVHTMLQRMNTLAVQSANGMYDDSVDRAGLQLEFEQIQDEIDHIAKRTDFNGMKLFVGEEDKRPVYVSDLSDPDPFSVGSESEFSTTQTGFNPNGEFTAEQQTVINILKDSIIPQAVSSILNTYSAFSYLRDADIGIGLRLFEDGDENAAALAGWSSSSYYQDENGEYKLADIRYRLSVNMAYIDDIANDEEARSRLERIICHEMMHVFMYESMLAGMSGYTSTGNKPDEAFPNWFIEGMAQTAGGPHGWITQLGIYSGSSQSEISAALSNNSLSNGSDPSATSVCYGTGYLACMYLGYMAAGSDADLSDPTGAAGEILSGLSDSVLTPLTNGEKSFTQIIKDITGYNSIDEFEAAFATDSRVLSFVESLLDLGLEESGNMSGSLVSGDLSDSDLLENDNIQVDLFELDPTHEYVTNKYSEDVNLLSGSTNTMTGVEHVDSPDPVSTSAFTVTGGTEGVDYVYNKNTLTILTDTALTITGNGNPTTDKLRIGSGVTANVTVNNVNIDVSANENEAAFKLEDGAKLNLTLTGENTFKSGSNRAGLQVVNSSELVITSGSTGTLNAYGGGTGSSSGAGIGSYGGHKAGIITIDGGTVNAYGADSAAGIGGGYLCDASEINITNGTVNASSTGTGAGIGGGAQKNCGTVNISGGIVNAVSSSGAAIGNGSQGVG